MKHLTFVCTIFVRVAFFPTMLSLFGCNNPSEEFSADSQSQPLTTARTVFTQPFLSSSPWNTPIGSAVIYGNPKSAPGCNGDVTAKMIDGNPLAPDINGAQWSHPVYIADSANPLTSIHHVNASEGIDTYFSIKLPAIAVPSSPDYLSGGDSHMHIMDPTGSFVDEMFHVQSPSGATGWMVEGHSRVSLLGNGWSDGGERAYGGSAIAGLIRAQEMSTGTIPHALAVALDSLQLASGPTWPATRDDGGSSYTGHVHMGQLLAIPKTSMLPSGLSAGGKAIFLALQQYGAYVVDTGGGGPILYAEPSADAITGPGMNALDPVRLDLQKIWPLVRCVANNSPTSVGGGGIQNRNWASPLAGGDLITPSVSISAPVDGSVVSGKSIKISSSARDNSQVAGIQFFVDHVPIGIEKAPSAFPSYPATFTTSVLLDSTTLTNGIHTLQVTARDAAGNFTTSTVSISINN